jgi:hypothetical protein
MPKFIQAFENLCPMRLRIAVRYGRCGSGRVSWIGRTYFGLSLRGQSKLNLARQRILSSSLRKAGFLALHLPCDTIRIFHWIAGALPKRVR